MSEQQKSKIDWTRFLLHESNKEDVLRSLYLGHLNAPDTPPQPGHLVFNERHDGMNVNLRTNRRVFGTRRDTTTTAVIPRQAEKETVGEIDRASKRKEEKKRKDKPKALTSLAKRDFCIKCGCDLECEWYDGVGEELMRLAENLREIGAVRNNQETRFAMYQNYTKIVHGRNTKGVRFPLPRCIETKIKNFFPNGEGEQYVGFKRQKTK